MNRRAVLFPAIVVLIAVGAWWRYHEGSKAILVPAATWRLGSGPDAPQGKNYDDVAPETPVRLMFRCDEPRYVYVFSHSPEDGTLLLHPSPDVKSDLAQPLAPGDHVLPGSRDGKELTWNSRRQVSMVTTFVVVAAREPIAALDALLPRLRRWTNTAMTDGSMQVTKPHEGTEMIAGPRTKELPDALLQRAADLSFTATVVNGPLEPDAQLPGVWIGSLRIREVPAPPTKPN
jgi:hypothetical protein